MVRPRTSYGQQSWVIAMPQIKVILYILTFFFKVTCISYKTSLESLCISHSCVCSSDVYSICPTLNAHGITILHVQYIPKYDEH